MGFKEYLEEVVKEYETEDRETGEDSSWARSMVAHVEERRYEQAAEAISGRLEEGSFYEALLPNHLVSIVDSYFEGELGEEEAIKKLGEQKEEARKYLVSKGFDSRVFDAELERREAERKFRRGEYKKTILEARKFIDRLRGKEGSD